VTWPNGERKYVYARTQKEAAERKRRLLAEMLAGMLPAPERLTVADLLHQWLTEGARSTVRPSTYRSYCEIARLHLVPELGKVRLTRLEPRQVERLMRKKLDAGLSPRRVGSMPSRGSGSKRSTSWRSAPGYVVASCSA
jgi:hypothetical protein